MKKPRVFVWRGLKLIDVKPDIKSAKAAYPGNYSAVFNGWRDGDVLLQPLQQIEVH